MQEDNFKNSIISATKWSLITEFLAKMIAPLTNLILSRLLTPEAFGVVATITMIITFADIFTDAGFQKYLIQYNFKSQEEKNRSITVAFWTNLSISILIWIVISIFSSEIAILVGSPGLGTVLTVSCIQLPLTAFSSIQLAIFKRNFDFKTLFYIRIVTIMIPFLITIPLALSGFSYWSLIIGTIAGQIANSAILTCKSEWRPNFYYNFNVLKEMFSFSVWTLFESISIWGSAWLDIFIIGTMLDTYCLGLYRSALNTVNLIFSLITAAIIPILFSSLSRVQSENSRFKSLFYKYQELAAYVILPMGVGIFLFSDVITLITLGKNWIDAGYIIGIWGLTTAFKIVLSDLNSECYRAKGLPKLSLILQVIHILFLVPTCYFSLKYGFKTLVYSRAFIRFQLVITSLFVMQKIMHISIIPILKQMLKPLFACLVMGIFAVLLRMYSLNIVWSLITILLCGLVYLFTILLISRREFIYYLGIIVRSITTKSS